MSAAETAKKEAPRASSAIHPIAEMYGRWVMDSIIELAQGVAHDFANRPRQYRHLSEESANALSDLRALTGTAPDWPDAEQRAMIYDGVLGVICQASVDLRRAALTFGNSNGTSLANRYAFVAQAAALRSLLHSLEGRAVSIGHQQTGSIFEKARQVLSRHDVTRAYGLDPVPPGGWSFSGNGNGDAAYTAEQIVSTIACPPTAEPMSQHKFILLQRLAHFGAATLNGVMDDSSGWDENERIDSLLRDAVGWASAHRDLAANIDVARSWRDPEYRASLPEVERAHLPANPAGEIAAADPAQFGFSACGDGLGDLTTNCDSVCCATLWEKHGGCCPDPKFTARS